MKRRNVLGAVAASSAAATLGTKALEAQQQSQPKPTRVTLLGTGTPSPSLVQQRSGYMIEVANDVCGNHVDNAETAKKAGVKTLVLTHLLAQIDQPRIREQIVHEIQKIFEGKVVWGEDLMRLTFAGATVGQIEGYQVQIPRRSATRNDT